MVLTNKYKP
ncbi:hypothetical protein YPPY64_1057, partial [Yersinia pestis PY-64]